MEEKNTYKTIDEYIALFPLDVQEKMNKLRQVIKDASPDATEKISWQMPTFYLYGNLVHFAAHKKHIGFYPGESGIENFKHKFAEFKSSKGAVQFPLDKEFPYELIAEIVRFRTAENIRLAEIKSKKK